jgi:SOS-response transcriptional repressor LexA
MERKIRIATVERDCGFSNGYLASLKKDLAGDKLFAVADYLDVNARWLVTGDYHVKDADLTNSEMDIIKKCRLLDGNGIETVSYIIDNELRRMDEIANTRQKAAEIIPLWRSLQPVSAGRGFYLSADEFETIIVRKTDETKQAAFCVPVQGDSMEPLYHDGDILLVGREKTLSKGQIGIFTVDGKGYVKKLNEGVLVSLNADYPDIPITEDTYCNGNVIGTLDKGMIYND